MAFLWTLGLGKGNGFEGQQTFIQRERLTVKQDTAGLWDGRLWQPKTMQRALGGRGRRGCHS